MELFGLFTHGQNIRFLISLFEFFIWGSKKSRSNNRVTHLSVKDFYRDFYRKFSGS